MVSVPQTWEQAPDSWWLSLDDTSVHVWLVDIDQMTPYLADLAALLDETELQRAERFPFELHRIEYVTAHGILRVLLGSYLAKPSSGIRFAHGAYGKPSIDGESGAVPLRFNMSHSHWQHIVYAISTSRDVGVDVEQQRDLDDAEALAQRYFSPRERAAVCAAPFQERLAAFFRCWTRKEAYIKATGLGFSMPLDAFDVTLGRGEPARLIEVRHRAQDAIRWTMTDLPPIPSHTSALVVEGSDWEPSCWSWTPVQMERALSHVS